MRNANASRHQKPGPGSHNQTDPLSAKSKPLESDTARKATDAHCSFWSPYRTGQDAICHPCSGCLPFSFHFFSDTFFERLAVSTEPRGLGAGLTAPSDTCRMQRATSEVSARGTDAREERCESPYSSLVVARQVYDDAVMYPAPRMWWPGPVGARSLSLGEAFGGVCFAFWLGRSPLLVYRPVYAGSARPWITFSPSVPQQ